jgi:hypothetical protein
MNWRLTPPAVREFCWALPPGGLFFNVGVLPHPGLDAPSGEGSLELVSGSTVALGSGLAALPSLTSSLFDGVCDGLESFVSLGAVLGVGVDVVCAAVLDVLDAGGTLDTGLGDCAAVVVAPRLESVVAGAVILGAVIPGAVMAVAVPSLGAVCGAGLVSASPQPTTKITPVVDNTDHTLACMVLQVSEIAPGSETYLGAPAGQRRYSMDVEHSLQAHRELSTRTVCRKTLPIFGARWGHILGQILKRPRIALGCSTLRCCQCTPLGGAPTSFGRASPVL